MAFRALPRPQFASLQTAIFPIYFSLQTALPVVVALTASRGGEALGLSGLTAPENRLNTLLPMATVAVTGLVNMFVLRPITVNVMRERKHQGKIRSSKPMPFVPCLLTLYRNPRWQAELRPCASLQGDACLEQEVWPCARHL